MNENPPNRDGLRERISLFFNSQDFTVKTLRLLLFSLISGGVFMLLEFIDSYVDHRIILKDVTMLSDSFYESVKLHVEVRENIAMGTKILIFKNYPEYVSEFLKGFFIFFLVSVIITGSSKARKEDGENKAK